MRVIRSVRSSLGVAAAFLASFAASAQQAPISYQGVVKSGTAAVNGPANFVFKLFSDAASPSQVGSTITQNGLQVTDGVFSTTLDFGVGVWTGADRWLETTVNGVVLTPRQKLAGVPYSHSTRGMVIDANGNIGLQIGPAAVLDQQYLTTTGSGNFGLTVWQSFTPSINGAMPKASFGFIPPAGGTNIYLEVRTGEGFGGTLLATSSTITGATASQMYDFTFPTPPTLAAGSKYSLVLKTGTNGQFSQVYRTCTTSGNGPYAGGTCWFGATCDLAFATYVTTDIPLLTATANRQVAINTTTPGNFLLAVNGTAANTTGTWSVFSDGRLKRDVTPIGPGTLDRLLSLRGYTFSYDREAHPDMMLPNGNRIGFLAEQVEGVFPDWVSTGPDGYRYLSEQGVTALTVEAMRELRKEKDADLAAARTRIEKLEAQNAELIRRLEKLEEAGTAK